MAALTSSAHVEARSEVTSFYMPESGSVDLLKYILAFKYPTSGHDMVHTDCCYHHCERVLCVCMCVCVLYCAHSCSVLFGLLQETCEQRITECLPLNVNGAFS